MMRKGINANNFGQSSVFPGPASITSSAGAITGSGVGTGDCPPGCGCDNPWPFLSVPSSTSSMVRQETETEAVGVVEKGML